VISTTTPNCDVATNITTLGNATKLAGRQFLKSMRISRYPLKIMKLEEKKMEQENSTKQKLTRIMKKGDINNHLTFCIQSHNSETFLLLYYHALLYII
jgi:hypothetical protein